MCCKSTTKQTCCVCLEVRQCAATCKYCIEGTICSDCIISMCEAGLCDRCPTCRQENWKKVNKRTSKITPVRSGGSKRDTESIDIRVERAWALSSTRSRCSKLGMACIHCCTFKTWLSLLSIFMMQWMLGLLVVCICSSSPRDMTIDQLTWISMLVGIPVMHLPLWYCIARCDIGVFGPISYARWILWQYTPGT